MAKKSVTIKAAYITGSCIVIAAIMGILRCNSDPKIPPQTNSSALTMRDIQGDNFNITINNIVPETETKKTIQLLQDKLNSTNDALEFTREEIRSLAVALKDLDQRTSGIEKLPDGRTKLGQYLAGYPTIVLGEHDASIKEYNNRNFQAAFEHSKKAINAFEESAKITEGQTIIQINNFPVENVAKLYNQGFLTALKVERKDLAHEWVQIAIDKYETIEKRSSWWCN